MIYSATTKGDSMYLEQLKRHATENVDKPERTLCGEGIHPTRSALRIDNVSPDCGRCLRVIAARYRRVSSR